MSDQSNSESPKRICTKCGGQAPQVVFHRHRGGKGGLRSRCAACERADKKQWVAENHDRNLAAQRKWASENRDRGIAYSHRSYYADRKKWKACADKWRKRNQSRVTATRKIWAAKNHDKVRISQKKSADAYRNTPSGKLNTNIAGRMRSSLKNGSKGGRPWEKLVGYTVAQLKRHLEKQFKPGMTWENYGPVWHVDHIIPIAVFNFQTPDDMDFKRCWALSNLQPLWKHDNLVKNKKLEKLFQPSLAI